MKVISRRNGGPSAFGQTGAEQAAGDVGQLLTVVRDCASNRLGRIWRTNDEALKERLWVYQQVLPHAITAGIDWVCAEFRTFLRSLFLMARLAGSRGLADETDSLFASVRTHSTEHRLQLAAFAVIRALLGWRLEAIFAERVRANFGKRNQSRAL